jgi:nucleotide-binding universal stress UspA family protein
MPGIVVGVDGSSHSRRALDCALDECYLRGAPLTVLTVCPLVTGIYAPGFPVQDFSPAEEEGRLIAEKATWELVSEAMGPRGRPPAAAVTVRAVTGVPAEELIGASQDAELLVVGARGAGGFARLIMGSVSTQVARHARCPVVVVPRAHAGAAA